MKHVIKWMLVAMFTTILFACSSDAAKSSNGDEEITDELVIFNWTSYMPDKVIKDFEEEFGVKVTYTTFASNQEMLTKVRSGTVPYDIAIPSSIYIDVMIENDLLKEINYDNIPNFTNISDQWKGLAHDPEDAYSITYMYGYNGLIYNKEKVEEAPTSWADLWNPAYKGHVMSMDAPDELNVILQQYLGNDILNPTEENIEEAGEVLNDLVPSVLKFTEAPKAELVNEEAWIVAGYSGEAAVAYQDNPNIDFVLPEEGGIKWSDNIVLPKSGENKATAEAFINYLLRPEVSKQLSEEFPYGNPNEAALELLSEEELNVPGLNLPAEQVEKAEWSSVLEPDKVQIVNRVIQEAKVKSGN